MTPPDPLTVTCPTCRVPANKRCVRPSGHALFGKESHATRWRAIGATPPKRVKSKTRIPDNILIIPQEDIVPRDVPDEPLQFGPLPLRRPYASDRRPKNTLDAFSSMPEPVYETQYGRVFNADSLAFMGHLDDESVDVVFTSPPYALTRQKEYGNESQDAFVAWFMPFVEEIRRVLKPSGFFVLNLGPAWVKGQPSQSLYDVETFLAISERMHAVADFVWHKPGTMPGPAQWVTIEKIRFTNATEKIWVYSKNPYALLDLQDVDFESFLRIPNKASNTAYDRRCRKQGVKQHPARFPPALPRYFLERLCKPGDLVLDPFAGSCTTGEVAEELELDWIGVELDREYACNSVLRFRDEVIDSSAVTTKAN